MSLDTGSTLQIGNWQFQGVSLSGIRTAVALPTLNIAFDVAQGFPFLLNCKKFFITHGHLDHSAGIPYIISQKAMNRQPPPVFYMPSSLIEPLKKIMTLWSEIEQHEYKFDFLPAEINDTLELNSHFFIRPFKTVHRIDSIGYTLFQKNKKLNPQFVGMTQNQLRELRETGMDLNLIEDRPIFSFTGDTQIEFLDTNSWVKNSEILFMETTFLDEVKPVEQARKWGHTHLNELIARLDEIHSKHIVLIHISSRYLMEFIEKLLDQKIPHRHRSRITVFPGR